MISKTVLTAMVVVLMAFSPAKAIDWNSYEDGRRDGESSERSRQAFDQMRKEREDQKRQEKRQEESDRKQRAIQEEKETKAQDARRESAYAESKAANKSKVNKMRKQAGMKPHNSWQLNH